MRIPVVNSSVVVRAAMAVRTVSGSSHGASGPNGNVPQGYRSVRVPMSTWSDMITPSHPDASACSAMCTSAAGSPAPEFDPAGSESNKRGRLIGRPFSPRSIAPVHRARLKPPEIAFVCVAIEISDGENPVGRVGAGAGDVMRCAVHLTARTTAVELHLLVVHQMQCPVIAMQPLWHSAQLALAGVGPGDRAARIPDRHGGIGAEQSNERPTVPTIEGEPVCLDEVP